MTEDSGRAARLPCRRAADDMPQARSYMHKADPCSHSSSNRTSRHYAEASGVALESSERRTPTILAETRQLP